MARADILTNRLREWERLMERKNVSPRFDKNEAIRLFCKAMKGSQLGDGIPFGGTRDEILMHCVNEEAWSTIVLLFPNWDDDHKRNAALFTFLIEEHKRVGPRGFAP